jgi:hypothetical protein
MVMKAAAKMLLDYSLKALANNFKSGNYAIDEVMLLGNIDSLRNSDGIDNEQLSDVYKAAKGSVSNTDANNQKLFDGMIESYCKRFELTNPVKRTTATKKETAVKSSK